MQNNRRNIEQGALNVCHVDAMNVYVLGDDIKVSRGKIEISQNVKNCNYHTSRATGWLIY